MSKPNKIIAKPYTPPKSAVIETLPALHKLCGEDDVTKPAKCPKCGAELIVRDKFEREGRELRIFYLCPCTKAREEARILSVSELADETEHIDVPDGDGYEA